MRAVLKHFIKALRRGLWTVERVPQHIDVAHGSLDPNRLTLFSIWRNEMFFAEAFFAHYRALGVQQFLILDDGSTDGTSAFLQQQQDCVTLRSDLSFGDLLIARGLDGKMAKMRAGKFLKIAVPHLFLRGQFSIYVDADEFLLLPPDAADLAAVIARLSQRGDKAALASVVEFYPSKLQDLTGAPPVRSIDDLFRQSPFFDARALLQISPDGSYEKIAPSASRRLFDREDVFAKASRVRNSPRHKTPLLLNDANAFRTGSHSVSVPVATDVLLCIAHFVFTARWKEKIESAQKNRSHADGASKYNAYAALYDALAKPDSIGFLGPDSARYTGAGQVQAAGLMQW